MNPSSAKSLVVAGTVSLLLGTLVGSPAGSLFLYVVAALLTSVPTAFGTQRARLAGAVILALSLLLAVTTYPRYVVEMDKYRGRGKTSAHASPSDDGNARIGSSTDSVGPLFPDRSLRLGTPRPSSLLRLIVQQHHPSGKGPGVA